MASIRALKITGVVTLVDVDNNLKALQHAVDGYIETITLRGGAVMIVDEEGMLKEKPLNPIAGLIAGTMIYGVALIVGRDSDEFCDVPDELITILTEFSDDLMGI